MRGERETPYYVIIVPEKETGRRVQVVYDELIAALAAAAGRNPRARYGTEN